MPVGYDPTTARWLSKDLVWDGTNRYAFVGNQFSTHVDYNGLEGQDYITGILPGFTIAPQRLQDLPLILQRALQNQERYQIGAHQNGSSGFYYTVQDLQQGSVQVVCSEEVMPLGVRRQRAKRMAEQAAFEARMFTLQGEIILSLPGASDYRDGYEWWTGYDLNERDRRLTPEEQYAAGRWLLLARRKWWTGSSCG